MAEDKLLDSLENDDEFRKWKEKHKDSYLAHIFRMEGGDSPESCLIGYYNKDDTITTFEINGNDICLKSSEKIFKPEGKAVKELDMKKVRLAFDQIREIADELREKKYKCEIPTKKISILQNIDVGQVWNITIVTASFNALNMKIDASTGEVLKHNITSLMQLGNFMK